MICFPVERRMATRQCVTTHVTYISDIMVVLPGAILRCSEEIYYIASTGGMINE
jgi:hypothetical protein